MEASWLPYVSRSSDPLVRAQPRGIFFLLSIISSSASTRNQVSSDFPLRRPVPKVAQSPTTTESCVYQTSNTSDFTRHIRASIIMNGGGDGYGQPATWQEHRTPDGRNYYYNPATKVTQWTKPEEMMSPAERALANQPWKEYTAEGGRKYWYNTETKQSSWEMPEVYQNALGTSGNPNNSS